MFFRQYNLGCLSLFSYLIGDTTTGRAVVVDPQRDVAGYLADAEAHGLRIERVIETHVHADFLSGHLELAAATGAVISYGSVAQPDFGFEPLDHGARLSLGETVDASTITVPFFAPSTRPFGPRITWRDMAVSPTHRKMQSACSATFLGVAQ